MSKFQLSTRVNMGIVHDIHIHLEIFPQRVVTVARTSNALRIPENLREISWISRTQEYHLYCQNLEAIVYCTSPDFPFLFFFPSSPGFVSVKDDISIGTIADITDNQIDRARANESIAINIVFEKEESKKKKIPMICRFVLR